MELPARLFHYWPHVIGAVTVIIALMTSAHAVLYKRDPRAAVLWIGVIWLVPLVGPILYAFLGVNRVRRKAAMLRSTTDKISSTANANSPVANPNNISLEPDAAHLNPLVEAVGRIVNRPLIPGNTMELLVNGDATYPAMLSAINAATRTISFSTYIFDHDRIGSSLVEALSAAVKRGVQVRVLVDAAGSHYSVPSIVHTLHHAHVPVARFLPTLLPWQMMKMNLRNHRKILVTDGRIGFTGGINIRDGNLLEQKPRHPIQDLHFRIEGPVVAQLQEAFAADWEFTTKESLTGEGWFPPLELRGSVVARAIPDGPDEDFEKLRWTILSALACARSSVRIMTPYFLPDTAIISALNLAALRGVRVDIILPSKNNLVYCHWASRAQWWQVLTHGCHIWLTAAPFDHSKLMLVDNEWALVGSGNWDARSLRLNFEFNLECYDGELAARLEALVQSKLDNAREVTLEEVDSRKLPERLRDGVARLLIPYL